MSAFATLPHALKSNGNKAADGQPGRTTLLGVGWVLPALPLVRRSLDPMLKLTRPTHAAWGPYVWVL